MKKNLLAVLPVLLLSWSCEDGSLSESQSAKIENKNIQVTVPEVITKNMAHKTSRVDIQLAEVLNSTLFANSNYKVTEVDIYSVADAATTVETVNQQFQSTLTSRWVPNDTRRNWNGDNDLNDIDWMAFTPLASANGGINAGPVYDAMYDKWEKEGFCKTLNIDKTLYDASMGNPSLILSIGGLPPAENPLADVSVVGFLPAEVMQSVLGSPNVLGVAFSFVFIDPITGLPVKTTRGKDDKAYTEVWFNNGFTWSNGVAPGKIDIQSVVLHEFGHTLNLGHFGILQRFTFEDGSASLVYQPVNTMNALYIGQPRNFLGPNDKGNYCEAWGSWPWN